MIEKSEDTFKKRMPVPIFEVGDIVHLAAPGDPSEKRNILKPRHKSHAGVVVDFPSTQTHLDRGHWGVKVQITAVQRYTSDFDYVTSGWNAEEPGTKGNAPNNHLALPAPEVRFSSAYMSDAAKAYLESVAHLLSRKFVLDGLEELISLNDQSFDGKGIASSVSSAPSMECEGEAGDLELGAPSPPPPAAEDSAELVVEFSCSISETPEEEESAVHREKVDDNILSFNFRDPATIQMEARNYQEVGEKKERMPEERDLQESLIKEARPIKEEKKMIEVKIKNEEKVKEEKSQYEENIKAKDEKKLKEEKMKIKGTETKTKIEGKKKTKQKKSNELDLSVELLTDRSLIKMEETREEAKPPGLDLATPFAWLVDNVCSRPLFLMIIQDIDKICDLFGTDDLEGPIFKAPLNYYSNQEHVLSFDFPQIVISLV